MENALDERLDGAAADGRAAPGGTAGGAAHSPWGADVAAGDILASRHGDHLLLQLRGSAQTFTVHDYFRKNAAGGYIADEVRFADGRLWQMRPGRAAAPAPAP